MTSTLAQIWLPHVPEPEPVINRFAGSIDGFFTSPRDADALVEFAEIDPSWRVLEPAAGEGAIVHALMRLANPPREIVAIELHKPFADNLRASCEQYGDRVRVVNHDYFKTKAPDDNPFDMAVLNPPYQHFLDVRFVHKALTDAHRAAALLLVNCLHNPKRAKVWNSAQVDKIDFLSKRPDPFENGNPKVYKPMREYIRISARRSEDTQRLHFPTIRFV